MKNEEGLAMPCLMLHDMQWLNVCETIFNIRRYKLHHIKYPVIVYALCCQFMQLDVCVMFSHFVVKC